MAPSRYAMQTAELDEASARMGGLAAAVRSTADTAGAAVSRLAAACPGSALEVRLPGLDLPDLTDLLAQRCQSTARRIAQAAWQYREQDRLLAGTFEPAAGRVVVPR